MQVTLLVLLYWLTLVCTSSVPIPAPVPIPVPSPIPSPVPAPVTPTYCLRQYNQSTCSNATLIQETSIPLSQCFNITLANETTVNSVIASASLTAYFAANCTSALTTYAYQVCYTFGSNGYSLFVNPLPCSQPNSIITVTTTEPVTTTTQTNCVDFYSASLCVGSPIYWYTIPCGPVCTQLTPTLYISTDCSTNVTGVYSDSGCTAFLTSSTAASCGSFLLNSGYRSFRVQHGATCPPLPSAQPTPTPTPAPTPAGLWCKKTYTSAGCVGLTNQTTGTCQTCSDSLFQTDCASNLVTRRSTSGCTGATLANFAFGTCYTFIAIYIKYDLGACVAPTPVPVPAPSPPTCATFWKSQSCSGVLTVTSTSNLQCFNESHVSLGGTFFSASAIKSFTLDCTTGLANVYTTKTCTGSSNSFLFNSTACVGWSTLYNLGLSTKNTTCATCISWFFFCFVLINHLFF